MEYIHIFICMSKMVDKSTYTYMFKSSNFENGDIHIRGGVMGLVKGLGWALQEFKHISPIT